MSTDIKDTLQKFIFDNAAVRGEFVEISDTWREIQARHDYPPAGREARWESSVAEQRAGNIHVRDGIDENEFVAMREARDATLDVPTLILPAIQVNVRAGRFPPADDNGISYLRIPLNALPTHKSG